MRRTLRAAAMAVAVLACSASGASATHTAYLDAFTPYQAGCQAKGVYALPAPQAPNPPSTLAPTAYRYTVSAVNASGETNACQPVTTQVSSPNSQVVLQWLATPDATAYRVYRSTFNGQTFSNLELIAVLPQAAFGQLGCANGGRCTYADRGQAPQQPGQTAKVAPGNTTSGHAVDLRIIQRIDYGGANNNSPATTPGDDPFPAALKTDKLRLPPGLIPNPGAAPKCALTGPNSLLGDPNVLGSDDPNEDACPRNTLVGTVQTLSRIPEGQGTRIVPTPGEIYNGTPKGNEPGRLYIVLRPACSAGSVVAPGTPQCTGTIGGPSGGDAREVSKEFLAAVANVVERSEGIVGVDTDIRNARDDSDLPDHLDVYGPTSAGGANQDLGDIPVQVRQLTQDLFGNADQGTADGADDTPFITLPTSCGVKTLTADKTTSNHTDSVSTASASLTTSGCEAIPFAPTIEAKVGGPGQNGPEQYPQLSVTVRQNTGEAATKSATVTLPPTLQPNVPALQIQCSNTQFAEGKCPESTIKGTATARTPLLPFSLGGPVYLLENPSGLPRLAVVLAGPGINITLKANLASTPEGLVNEFPAIPEVPLAEFTLNFAGGQNGTLFNSTDLCKGAGSLKASFRSWNDKTADRTAALQVDQRGCPSQPYAVPTVGRPGFSARISRVRSGRPRYQGTATSGLGRRTRSVRFSVPKGLSISRAARHRKYIRVFAGGKRIPRSAYRVSSSRRTITVTRSSTKITVIIDRGALRESSTIRRRGRNQRLRFGARITLNDSKVFNLSVRTRPRS